MGGNHTHQTRKLFESQQEPRTNAKGTPYTNMGRSPMDDCENGKGLKASPLIIYRTGNGSGSTREITRKPLNPLTFHHSNIFFSHFLPKNRMSSPKTT